MRHSIDELLDVVHRHYPRRIPHHDPRYAASEEYLRLAQARERAVAGQEPWRAMLARLNEKFPDPGVENRSLHLASMPVDACYSGALHLPDGHALGFFVSFLAPYFIVYSSRFVDDPDAPHAPPIEERHPESLAPSSRRKRQEIRFDLSPDEEPYAARLASEIQATFGCERLPPDVGSVTVPDVETNGRRFGDARLYDCLMSDDW